LLVKNYFANKYGYTPEQVDKLDEKTIKGFLIIETEKEKEIKRKQTIQEHLSRQRGYK